MRGYTLPNTPSCKAALRSPLRQQDRLKPVGYGIIVSNPEYSSGFETIIGGRSAAVYTPRPREPGQAVLAVL